MRISAEQRRANEDSIRAAMDQLLDGKIPPDGKCDIKTLARHAGVDRTAFYGTRPYTHLREEFEQRLQALHASDQAPDLRVAQITRLKDELETLSQRISRRDLRIAELTAINAQALSRLAAQHDEITALRQAADADSPVRRLPTRAPVIGPCS